MNLIGKQFLPISSNEAYRKLDGSCLSFHYVGFNLKGLKINLNTFLNIFLVIVKKAYYGKSYIYIFISRLLIFFSSSCN